MQTRAQLATDANEPNQMLFWPTSEPCWPANANDSTRIQTRLKSALLDSTRLICTLLEPNRSARVTLGPFARFVGQSAPRMNSARGELSARAMRRLWPNCNKSATWPRLDLLSVSAGRPAAATTRTIKRPRQLVVCTLESVGGEEEEMRHRYERVHNSPPIDGKCLLASSTSKAGPTF